MERVLQQLGGNLRRRRCKLGLSQEGLADRAGLDRTLISSIERGKKLARIDTLVKLSCALELSLSDLVEGIALRRPGAS